MRRARITTAAVIAEAVLVLLIAAEPNLYLTRRKHKGTAIKTNVIWADLGLIGASTRVWVSASSASPQSSSTLPLDARPVRHR